MSPTDRALAWAAGTLWAFGAAAFVILDIIAPAVRAVAPVIAGLSVSH